MLFNGLVEILIPWRTTKNHGFPPENEPKVNQVLGTKFRNRTITLAELLRTRGRVIATIEDARDHVTRWLWTYNNERPNMANGGLTAAE
jgi:transposase InsO family protein